MESFTQVIPFEAKPTSEWGSHSVIHNWLMQQNKPLNTILHTHPTALITISIELENESSKVTILNKLSEILPELDYFIPVSMSICPYAPPGSALLESYTLDAIKSSNVILWSRHGLVVAADGINQAFDISEVITKAAEIFLRVR